MGRKPTGIVADIREVAGEAAARAFVEAFGGLRVSIPAERNLRETSPIAKAIGMDAARLVCRELVPASAGFSVTVPLGMRERRIEEFIRLKGEGVGMRTIARRLGIHPRTAFSMQAKLRAQGRIE